LYLAAHAIRRHRAAARLADAPFCRDIHVLCQWVDDDGSRINLEGSCGGGGDLFPDEHYYAWPRPMTPEDRASDRYLRPLTRAEEFALFLETRGHCLTDNGRFDEAAEAYGHAVRLAPHWSQYDAHMRVLHLERDRAAGVFCRDVARTPFGGGLQMTINSPVSVGFQLH
jgi:hypothetical protein